MMPLAGIGFLMKYILVPGTKRNELYGSGVDLEFLGLDRHEWGKIHFVISIVLLVLLVLHIILHWKMIGCMYQRLVPGKILRKTLAIILGLVSMGMIAFALFVTPEMVEHEPLYRNREHRISLQKRETSSFTESPEKQETTEKPVVPDAVNTVPAQETKGTSHTHEEYPASYYEINGSLTLQYVAEKYGVDVTKLAADLNIPVSLAGEKLGRLKRQFPFNMEDVRESILKNKKITE